MRLTKTIIFLLIGFSSCGQDSKKIETLYLEGDLKSVVAKGRKILSKDSENLLVNHLMGRALTDQKKYKKAKKYLENSIKKESPNWIKAWSYGYLGICNYATNDFEESKRNLLKSIEFNATKNSIKFAMKRLNWFQMNEYFEDWEMVESSNIRFHFQPKHGIRNLEEYCKARENAYQENNIFFEASPYKKIDFYIWSKPTEGKKIIGKAIGFANSDLCIINSKIEQTKGHEITHILCDYGIKPEKRNRLINEGLAVAFDLTNRNKLELAKTANIDNLGIRELMTKAKELPESLLYPIGGALIEFLRNIKGDEKLKLLIQNQTWENLIKLYGKKMIAEFEKKIKNEK